MYDAWTCLREHDVGTLGAAAAICLLTSLAASLKVGVIEAPLSRIERLLLTLIAFPLGSGVWATHFVAMLAYDTRNVFAYEPLATAGSGAIIILGTGIALNAQSLALRRIWRPLSGVIFGLSVGAMHFYGIQAVIFPGVVAIDTTGAALAILAGAVFSALAFTPPEGLWRGRIWTTGFLVIGILTLHMGGMAATEFLPLGIPVPTDWALRQGEIRFAAGFMALLLLSVPGIIWLRSRLALQHATLRLHGLAEAAFDGLAICDDRLVIRHGNHNLAALLGTDPAGTSLAELLSLPQPHMAEVLREGEQSPVLVGLRGPEGPIPAELRARRIELAPQQSGFAVALRDMRERIAAEARMYSLAHQDSLTGLHNRHSLQTRLARAVLRARSGQSGVAVFCMDLDHFKDVNDEHGHMAGDLLLCAVAKRCLAEIRQGDVLARPGGDEFVLLVEGEVTPDMAEELANRLLRGMAEPFQIRDDLRLRIGASIGIVLFPTPGLNGLHLLAKADVALYEAKRLGRNRHAIYTTEMDREQRDQKTLQADLTMALQRGEISLAYQPQVEAAGGTVIGFEALVRWRHPVHGLIPPDIFIPMAESSGFIRALGAWVRETACREAASWERPLRIAVNVSVAELRKAEFAPSLLLLLEQTGLAPSRLEIEVTETMLISGDTQVLANLERLRRCGVHVAMDDFGIGYSSLSALRAFPYSRIKLDRGFIQDMENRQSLAIIRAVIRLGQELGMPVIAEGVETEAQRDLLAAEGGDEFQGYLFGRPLPIEAYREATRMPPAVERDSVVLSASAGG